MNVYLRVTMIVFFLVLLVVAFTPPALGQQALLYQENLTADKPRAGSWNPDGLSPMAC